MLLLEVEGVTSGYHRQAVLRDLTFNVNQGAAVGIIGPNGHGKTTLLRTISGLIPLMSGDIRFEGNSLKGIRPEKIVEQGIVHIPQGDHVFAEMSVLHNLNMGAYLPSAHAKLEQRLQNVFRIFPRLEERQAQTANTLSGGERRMLALGRGLMTGGKILMIDEPSLGLAPIAVDLIYDVIRQLKADGLTILIVEENISRIVDFVDHIYLVDNGKFVWDGVPEELTKRDEILQTYLGS
ncbi:MAG: ABC transporter ATP-binding protein [Alphaproteobacteria bacterium]|nr:MAG: ABC transporter ATP-binding protein [Alphaproteobacteria bacterium]